MLTQHDPHFWKVGQDLVYGVTYKRTKSPTHILLAYAVKSLTGCAKLVRILNHLGHGISYTQLEETDTFPSLFKLEAQNETKVTLSEAIQPYVFTTLSWDNVDRLQETLIGKGTSHKVNGIKVQADVQLPEK